MSGTVPDPDPRLATLEALVARAEGAARGVARLATAGAVLGGAGGLLLWLSTTGHRVDDSGQDAAVSVLVLVLCLLPAGWLLNVRFSLLALLALPAKLAGVTVRRGTHLLTGRSARPVASGRLATIRSLRGIIGDYGDVVGSWATMAQVLAPTFWAITAVALLAVPVVVALAVVAGLLKALA